MTPWPAALVNGVAVAITAAGLLAAGVTLVATRHARFALMVLLDFLLAAGLLRLTGHPGWTALAGAAAVVVLRSLVGLGLRPGARPAIREPAPR